MTTAGGAKKSAAAGRITARRVKLDEIRQHDLDVTVPVRRKAAAWQKRAALEGAGAGRLPPIRLGTIRGGPLYLMGDGDVYRGCVAAGLESAACEIEECPTVGGFLVRHVQCNGQPAGFNPLKLREIKAYLERHGRRREVADLEGMYNGTASQKFLALDLSPEAAAELGDLCKFLGTRLSQFILPYYIPHMISKHETDKQASLARSVSGLVRGSPVTDARFAWPSPEEVNILLSVPTREAARRDKDGTPADDAAVLVPDGEVATKESKRRARQLVRRARNVFAIPGTVQHPPYVVDLKARRVSEVDERDSVTVLSAVEGSDAWLFPPKAGRWLGLDDGGSMDVKMLPFDGSVKIEDFAKRHKDAHGVIFYR